MPEPKFNKVDQLHVRGTVGLTVDKSQRDKERVGRTRLEPPPT